jgi:N-acetylmuramidase/Putative peptidoglycan binding domain
MNEIEKPTNYQVLMKGAKGEQVEYLQKLLNTHGSHLLVDGDFGNVTEKEVKSFQSAKGIVFDGIVGPITWRLLESNSEVLNKFLIPQDFEEIAQSLGIEVACIKAVYEVESNRSGFLPSGNPTILFEAQIFWGQLQIVGLNPYLFLEGNQNILSPTWNRALYIGGEYEYQRLNQAKAIHETAALKSASWGSFQIMGFNYKICGYDSVELFVQGMYTRERAHLQAFANFIRNQGLVQYLAAQNWGAFAMGYNGAGFRQNQYDIRLMAAYQRYKA